MPKALSLTPFERAELALEACCDPRTVKRVYDGRPIRSMTATRIRRAAKSLGIKLPNVAMSDKHP